MTEQRLETIDVDLAKPRTETERRNAEQCFILAMVPGWFRWLTWVFALGLLRWVADKSGSLIVNVLFYSSLGLLGSYYESFFYRYQFLGLPLSRSERQSRVWSLTIAGVIAFATYGFTFYLVQLVSKYR